jgi:protocatechuate 3,4-dioxygenase beta subunit
MTRPDPLRRSLIFGLAGLLAGGPALARQLLPTPQQTAGPFYPLALPLDNDNDLTQVRGHSERAQGRIADVTGRVLDLNGRPLHGVRVEIWQCDATGRYRHPGSAGASIDPNFQGFGHTVTDRDGRYRFRTIRPVPYPGRTPHIHFAVVPDDAPRFTTQLYVEGEPRNESDFLFSAIPADRRGQVLAAFEPTHSEGAELSAHFDIVLGGTDGTPTG